MVIVCVIVGWLACSVAAYLLFRTAAYLEFGTWSRGDRRLYLVASALGPSSLLAAIVFVGAYIITNVMDDSRDARW